MTYDSIVTERPWCAGCNMQPGPAEGAVRLVGGFGTPCDPLHSGFVEIFHDDDWGRICLHPFDNKREPEDRLVADVACRQLGFPHGTLVLPRAGESQVLAPLRHIRWSCNQVQACIVAKPRLSMFSRDIELDLLVRVTAELEDMLPNGLSVKASVLYDAVHGGYACLEACRECTV